MIRIIMIISRFLLLGLVVNSIIYGIACLMKWPQSVSAVFVGFYFAAAIVLYVQQRIWIMKDIWKHLSSQDPKFKNLMICSLTAAIFAISSIITRFIFIPLVFRAINILLATALCCLLFSLLYYSNLEPLKKFWHFMIAKPKEQNPTLE